ncbi:MAG: DNA-processing protein DprA [Candidatus Marinimicrobia bacterium]|nr:DNA-processing protein DprA [Candidatus Neomarinimicrobiota bacterium]
MPELTFRGDEALFNAKHKIAFLCSRDYPASVVQKSYEWALEQKNAGNCVVSGFHSQIERDVLHFLLKGDQPVIMVLARSMYKRLPDEELKSGIEKGNLLIVSPFPDNVKRSSTYHSRKRNEFMVDLSDEVVIAHQSEGGMIAGLAINKPVYFL